MLTEKTQRLVNRALKAVREETAAKYQDAIQFTSPNIASDYCILNLAGAEREHFNILLLDNQNRLITSEILFSGTIDAASVYPREVVKLVLAHNANAVILSHNHPSGKLEPSQADRSITQKIVDCLNMIDVRVLDHLIVNDRDSYSFAEKGLI